MKGIQVYNQVVHCSSHRIQRPSFYRIGARALSYIPVSGVITPNLKLPARLHNFVQRQTLTEENFKYAAKKAGDHRLNPKKSIEDPGAIKDGHAK